MTESTTAVRWGDGRRADSDFAREQILDAACRCYAINSIYKTSMEHIAREAKVSRTTIYRYFENRDEVLTGVLVRAIFEIIEALRVKVANTTSFGDFLLESQVLLIEMVPTVPLFVMFLQEQAAVMSRLCIGSADVIELLTDYFQQRFDTAKAAGEIRDGVEIGPMVDWVLHISSSYILSPTMLRGGDYEWREMLQRFLLPAIVRGD
jgi:TetR/AcrR family transcriptional regulator